MKHSNINKRSGHAMQEEQVVQLVLYVQGCPIHSEKEKLIGHLIVSL
jgi:hypothetical protein